MLSWRDMERLIDLAASARRGDITFDEKGEYRAIMSKMTDAAQDLAFDDLVRVSMTWIGFYHMAKMGAEAHAASAS